MYSFSKIVAVAFVIAVFIASVYSANLEVPQAFSRDMRDHKVYKRKHHVDRFAFAEDSEKEDSVALACCPCGGHHCCGSMCHG